MALALINGDYAPDGAGKLKRVSGAQAVLARVLMKLTARRGSFPFMEEFGSELYTLGRLPRSAWQSAAEQFVALALADEEDLRLGGVSVREEKDGRIALTAEFAYDGETLDATVFLQE